MKLGGRLCPDRARLTLGFTVQYRHLRIRPGLIPAGPVMERIQHYFQTSAAAVVVAFPGDFAHGF